MIIVPGLLRCRQGAYARHVILDLGMAVAEQERLAAQVPPFRQRERGDLRVIEDAGAGVRRGTEAAGP